VTIEPNESRPQRLAGRVALVTGASRGIGRFLAEVLAREGARVALVARSERLLAESAAAIGQAGGIALPVTMDVGAAASVAQAFETVAARLGVPTIVVNNAGITDTTEAIHQTNESFDRILDVNLRGPWLVSCEAARRLIAAGTGGTIVNVASILGLRQGGQVSAYATTKAGLIQMTRQLALEWARHGIRVNALAPGYVETDFNREFFASEKGAALVRRIPMRRLVRMEELAEPLMLLAGEGGAGMTGVVVPVDCGHLLSGL
jgi:NAD(P)-dependent dehydrogenase (short-subunit alcohol dehydrogenase family)